MTSRRSMTASGIRPATACWWPSPNASATATRPGDTVARFGGDEFAVLVESGTMPEAAEAVAERITEALAPTFRVHTNDVTMRASIGIALGQRPQETPDDLLRDADLAMYLAKRNGKGRFEMYRPNMHADAVRRLETAVGIRDGLEADQFEVFYQPIVNTHTGRLIGAEALVRWNHPIRGLLAPIEFIPIAEATGLIVPLGRQVLRDATRQAQEWRQSGLVDDELLRQRQPLGPSAPRTRPGRRRLPCPGRLGPPARGARPGGHRECPHRKSRRHPAPSSRPQMPRRPPRGR